jgi:hypothetical protein
LRLPVKEIVFFFLFSPDFSLPPDLLATSRPCRRLHASIPPLLLYLHVGPRKHTPGDRACGGRGLAVRPHQISNFTMVRLDGTRLRCQMPSFGARCLHDTCLQTLLPPPDHTTTSRSLDLLATSRPYYHLQTIPLPPDL